MTRIRNNNNTNNNDFLSPNERAFHILQSIEGTQHIIDLCMKHYDENKDLASLQIAADGYVTLGEMLRKVQDLYSYGHDFELTK